MSTSSLVGMPCSRCHGLFTQADELVACSACGSVHHAMCWGLGERCATPGCLGTPTRKAPEVRQMTAMPPPPPMMTHPPQLAPGYTQATIQMEGDRTLIVRDGTVMPPICIVTGKRNDLVKRKRIESWAPAWTFIFILLGLLIFVIIRLVMQKRATIELYLDREYAKARVLRSLGNTALFLLLFIGAIYFLANENEALGFFLFCASVFAPIIIFATTIQLYSVVHIKDGVMKIKFRKPEQAQAIYNAAMTK